jgi:dCMP deaminase
MINMRISKSEYYLGVAKAVSARSTCRRKKYGAVIVQEDKIVATGYNGSPRGEVNCCDVSCCDRQKLNIPSGSNYELCKSVHAEANAIINASKEELQGATLYLYGYDLEKKKELNAIPCLMCIKLIKNAGISFLISNNTL